MPRLLQLEIPPPAEHIKEVKTKPERKVLQPKSRPKQKSTASVFPQKPFYEVDEEAKTIIIIGLPIEGEVVEWKIENKVLKVKSPRLDFQYKEVIEIPKDWQAQEPKTKFVNGILAFQF